MSRGAQTPDAGQAPQPVSKSQVKREMLGLQKLAEQLAGMPPQRLDSLPIGDELRLALAELQRIRAHGARRRQVRRAGKLLSGADRQLIERLVATVEQPGREQTERFHRLERWRDRLLRGEPDELTRFLDRHRDADPQHVRQLVRTARKEQAQGRPPTASRKLFKYLRELPSLR